MRTWLTYLIFIKVIVACYLLAGAAFAQSSLQVDFLDGKTQQPISCRIEFVQPTRRYPIPKPSLVRGNQILVESSTTWAAPVGNYEFRVDRGPEFAILRSGFAIEKNARDRRFITVDRQFFLRKEGWYSGDLLSFLPIDELGRWQAADDLDVAASVATAPIVAPSNGTSPAPKATLVSQANSEPDESNPLSLHTNGRSTLVPHPLSRGLLLHGWQPAQSDALEGPSPRPLAEVKRSPNVHVEIQSPCARDVPIWLASERIDSVQLLSGNLRPDAGERLDAQTRNPDPIRFIGPRGQAKLAEYIYWQMLEAGFRMPPTAGTGFGGPGPELSTTHLGYNRVYVALDDDRTAAGWWKALKAGKTFVTNGPLLRAKVNGYPPGELFEGTSGQTINLQIDIELTVRDPVEYLDVIFNGQPLYQARLEDHARRGRFPALQITESGWLVLRVITEHADSYRMATTAPYYFVFDERPRISRKAVEFFDEWLADCAKRIAADEPKPNEYDPYLRYAKEFWVKKMTAATAD